MLDLPHQVLDERRPHEEPRCGERAASREAANYHDKVEELQDQVRDIMFFLEAKEKIQNGDGAAAEAAGGTLEVSQTPESKTSRRKKGKH